MKKLAQPHPNPLSTINPLIFLPPSSIPRSTTPTPFPLGDEHRRKGNGITIGEGGRPNGVKVKKELTLPGQTLHWFGSQFGRSQRSREESLNMLKFCQNTHRN